jgi:hypothetical protein
MAASRSVSISATSGCSKMVRPAGPARANAFAAASLTRAFRLLFEARFPIWQMRVVDDFGGDDERSMLADNTSAFNCRLVPGTSVWAQHAYGLAVDINPFENPEILVAAAAAVLLAVLWSRMPPPSPPLRCSVSWRSST